MSSDPSDLLPLKPLEFRLLLALSEREQHGYGLVKQLTRAAVPGPRLFPASLYRTLRGMREDGLIEECPPPRDIEADDDRRQYFRVTAFGRRVAAAEGARMRTLIQAAEDLRLLDAEGQSG